jgi:hypothetical protein
MKKRVRIYHSYEKQEDAQRIYASMLTPEQCLKEAVMLIRKVYQYDANTRTDQKHIRITRSS